MCERVAGAAGDWKIWMHGSIRPFQFDLPRDIKLPEAKTTKDQTIRKRMEAAFIESMQCKPVSALPAGGKWTFEIKFDGYRCIAMKRGSEVTLFRGTKRCLTTLPRSCGCPRLARGRVRRVGRA